MPLDGDDEVGLFCILLPQPLDRSMKNIEAWRPYEVRNDGDGKKFDNNFVLYTLRYTDQDVGTKDTILAALGSRKAGTGSESHMIGSTSVEGVTSEADSLGGLDGASAIPPSKKQEGKTRKAQKDSVSSRNNHQHKRNMSQAPDSGLTPSVLTERQAENVHITWVLDTNGELRNLTTHV